MTPTGPRRRGRPPGSVGSELLARAREVFCDRGFRGTTMDAVAARAHVSKQSLYAAYPSKDALFAAVVRDWVERGRDALEPPTRRLAEAVDVRDGLLGLAAALQAGILGRPVLRMRALVAAESEAFPDVAADYLAGSWGANMARLASALRTLAGRGLLRLAPPDDRALPDPAELAAEQFVWLVVGAPLNRLALGEPTDPDPARLRRVAEEAVTTFLARYGRPQ
jgi:TetR/AcrR family transcriptional regulator, mexJK operon transcriptional repressor